MIGAQYTVPPADSFGVVWCGSGCWRHGERELKKTQWYCMDIETCSISLVRHVKEAVHAKAKTESGRDQALLGKVCVYM